MKKIKILFRNIPSVVLVVYVVSIVCMNLLANKSIDTGVSWITNDYGLIFSWFVFLTMDIITKHFGPKEATIVSVFGLLCNLVVALLFYIISILPGTWGEFYATDALNITFGGTWYVLLGSSVAFIVSAVVNNTINWAIGKLFRKDNFLTYACRTYVSTFIGQFVDNLIFALIVSLNFFGWNLNQCFGAAFVGCVFELLAEIIFSPLGYKIVKKWGEESVGEEYKTLARNDEKKFTR